MYGLIFFTLSIVLSTFLMFQGMFLYYFPSVFKTSLSYYFGAVLLVTDLLGFLSSENGLISLHSCRIFSIDIEF